MYFVLCIFILSSAQAPHLNRSGLAAPVVSDFHPRPARSGAALLPNGQLSRAGSEISIGHHHCLAAIVVMLACHGVTDRTAGDVLAGPLALNGVPDAVFLISTALSSSPR